MAGLGDERQIIDQGLLQEVAEGDVLELDPPVPFGRQKWVNRVGAFLRGVEELEDSLRRGDAGLEQVRHRGNLGQRLRELPRVLDEGLDVAEGHGAVGNADTADDGDRDVVQVSDEHHRRQDEPRDELGAEARFEQLLVPVLEHLLDLAPAPEHGDQIMPGERFFDMPVQRARVLPLRYEELLGALCDLGRDHHRDRDRHQRNHSEERRHEKHHQKHADDGQRREEQLADRLLQRLGEVVDVVRDAAQDLAAGLLVEEPQGKAVELALDLGSELEHRPLHDVVEKVALHPAED